MTRQRLYYWFYRSVIVVFSILGLVFPIHANANMTFIRDAEIESTLYKLSDPIFQVAGLEGRVDLYIIQDPTLNAFVAGGSNIFLHTGLIQELDKPEELIGVIAHETGHITGGHLARRGIAMRQATGPATVAMLLGIAAGVVSNSGDVGMAAITGGQQYIQRSLLKYTRSEEASADQAGLTYMLKAGIDPHAMITTLERFQGQEVFSSASQDPYALTHPLSYERIESLRQRIEENATNVSPVNEDLQYWHQRMRAKFDGFLEKPRDILAKIPPQTNNEFELYSLAIALHRLPDPQKASETVTKLLDIRPNDPFYHELKGQILLESGQGGQAINPYETAVSLAPDEPLLLAGLGRALLSTDTKEDNTKALKSLEDAARQDSQDASIRQYLAIAYARNGMDGMASLATAESFAIRQNIIQAKRHAEHASALLDNGSPAWIRAQDIIALPDPDDEKDR